MNKRTAMTAGLLLATMVLCTTVFARGASGQIAKVVDDAGRPFFVNAEPPLTAKLNVGEDGILAQVEKLSQTAKHLEKELEAQKRKGALSQLDELVARVQMIKGVKVIAAEVENVDREGLRQLVDSLRQKLGSGVVALGMPEDGKVALIAGVTKDLTARVHAGKLIQALAKQVGGSGGGRPDLAEAGGKDTAGLKRALQSVPSLIESLL